MKKLDYKLKISTISLTLLLTISAIFVTLPSVTGQVAGEKMTYAFIGAIPNPVGKGQSVLLHVGVTQELQNVDMGWEGLSVTIERPDGQTDTITDIRTDSTGGTTVNYTPDMAGSYFLTSHFPEQVTTPTKGAGSMFTGYVPTGTVMLASDSQELELVVQEDPIPYYPGQSKPNEYWTRPIDAQLREWSPLAGSWLWGAGVFGGADVPNRYAPYNDDAPDSAHILWTKPFTIGGLTGGATGDHGMECGDAYEGKWGGSLVVCGMLYYRTGAYDRPREWHCVDIHTGEEQWSKVFQDNETLDFGQLFYWDSYNYHGVFPYIYVATGGGGFFFGPAGPETWTAYDPFTGEWRFTIENVPSGTRVIGPNGEFYKFDVDLTAGRLEVWNMTALISNEGSWGSQAHLQTHDGDDPSAWTLNVSIPTGLPGSVQEIRFGDKILGGSVSTTEVTSWAISLEPGQEGTELYRKTWNAPASWALGNETVSWYGTSIEEGVFVVWSKETRQFYGFSTETGDYLWTTQPQYYLDFHVATEAAIVYGKLYSCGVSGIVYAYDLETGEYAWDPYEATDPYQEILWTNHWWAQIIFITDGKLYIGHSEHSVIDPKPRGAPFQCIDAETGELIWRADGLFRQTHWGGTGVIGDSIFATQDSYDQRVYGVGKGPSEITATINNNVAPRASSVLVTGTVMDVSPGTKDDNRQLRFPNGVPAVSDESMSEWMLYVYKQFSRPDATGVTVKFAAVDPNNNYIEIGDTVSDSYGNYAFNFIPDNVGQYMIIATFEGSNSYYPSTAITYLNVVQEAEPFPDVPTAEEIAADAAQRTIAMLPKYPDVPTQEQVADDAARRTIAMLPQYPEYTAAEMPAYQTVDIVIIVLVVVVVILMLYIILKKQK